MTEILDYVPGAFRVVRHVRPKLSCRTCEALTQAPAPSLPINRGRAGTGLLVHVLVAKNCDHLPLHRQAEIYARDDVDLPRLTLADMVGQVAARLVRPRVDALARHVMRGGRVPFPATRVAGFLMSSVDGFTPSPDTRRSPRVLFSWSEA